MLSVTIDERNGIAVLAPAGALSKRDFENATAIVDPYIEKAGGLNGVIIHTETFPGWDSFAALVAHLEFVKEHHKRVSRVALVTDSPIGSFAQAIANHFVVAEIRRFPFREMAQATAWIRGQPD